MGEKPNSILILMWKGGEVVLGVWEVSITRSTQLRPVNEGWLLVILEGRAEVGDGTSIKVFFFFSRIECEQEAQPWGVK